MKHQLNKLMPHFWIWLVVLVMPILLTVSEDEVKPIGFYIKHFIPLFFILILFYLNYFWLIDKYFFQKQKTAFILINAFIVLFLVLIFPVLHSYFLGPELGHHIPHHHSRHRPNNNSFFYMRNLIIFGFSVASAIAVKASQRLYVIEAEKNNLENQQLKSNLTQLKYQLQPHFFFNVLNTIYAQIIVAPEIAQDSIHKLSKMMRYLLYDTNDNFVPIDKEIAFLQNFIALMKPRLPRTVAVKLDFEEHIHGNIAPLMLITLVENAFKHGISAEKDTQISIKLFTENQFLLIEVENGNYPVSSNLSEREGIGLANLMQRLKLIYVDKFDFRYGLHGEIFKTYLRLPL